MPTSALKAQLLPGNSASKNQFPNYHQLPSTCMRLIMETDTNITNDGKVLTSVPADRSRYLHSITFGYDPIACNVIQWRCSASDDVVDACLDLY